MNCYEAQKKIPEYLDDMLAETVRKLVRDHLSHCETCQNHTLRLGSLASNLKQLARVKIPFDLTGAILTQLDQEPALRDSFFNARRSKASFFVLLGVVGIVAIIYFSRPQPHKISTPPLSEAVEKPGPEQARVLLEELKQLDSKLARVSKNRNASETPQRPAVFKVSNMAPIHWHLRFKDAAARGSFTEKLKAFIQKSEFEADYFLSFSIASQSLPQLLPVIRGPSGVLADEPKIDLEQAASFDTAIPVTFFMETEGSSPRPLFWRLRFLRQDGYLFIAQLREAGFVFIYEMPDLLILQISQEQYAQLQFEVKERLGLQVLDGKGELPFPGTSGQTIPILLSFEES